MFTSTARNPKLAWGFHSFQPFNRFASFKSFWGLIGRRLDARANSRGQIIYQSGGAHPALAPKRTRCSTTFTLFTRRGSEQGTTAFETLLRPIFSALVVFFNCG